MKLYLIRHGKTADHENKIRQSPDSALGKIGHAQAKALANRLRNEKFDVLLSSPWPRALTTSQYLSKSLNLPIEIEETLHEQHNNPVVHSISYGHKIAKEYLKDAQEFGRKDMDWKFRGLGESRKEILDRAAIFKKLLMTNYANKSVLVVSHGGFLSALIPILIADHLPMNALWKLSYAFYTFENTSITHLEYNPTHDEWTLKYFNDASHLGE